MKVGVLAMQGAFIEHEAMLRTLDVETIEVRKPEDLDQIDGLILPGGESTTIGKLLKRYDLLDPLREKICRGFPVFGTCAGMILLSRHIEDGMPDQPVLGVLNVITRRNAFGRQVDSFEADLTMPVLGEDAFPAVFIRAPIIMKTLNNVQILGSVGDTVVAVREGNILATAFHPELTGDTRVHEYFLGMIKEGMESNG